MTMPDLWTVLSAPLVELLGWVLLHFMWQGALLAAGLAGTLYALRGRSPTVRYAVSCAALVGLLALPLGTGLFLNDSALLADPAPTPSVAAADGAADSATIPSLSALETTPAGPPPLQARAAAWLRPALPWIVLGWAVGVLLFSVRLASGAWRVRRLRRASTPAPERWRDRLRSLADQMGLRWVPVLRISDPVDSPAVAGWWRPVVLVPAGLLSSLPPEQVEALLLHELAHVRRHDVLVGRLQAVVETLFFFHPATWWISRQVQQTREACCDDLAVRAGPERTVYARALAALAERTVATPRPAGTLVGSDGALYARIHRLLISGEKPSKNVRRLSIAVALALLLGVPALFGACASQQASTSDASQRPGTQEQADAEQKTEISDFLLVVGTTANGFTLKCEEGCAWTELGFSTPFGGKQFVDQYGMTTRSEERDRDSSDLANFLITLDRAETEAGKIEVRLECKKGCAWKTLSFSGWDEWEQVRQPVDQNGMTRFAGIGEGRPEKLREQSRRLREQAERLEEWAEGRRVPPVPDSVRGPFPPPIPPNSLKRPFRGPRPDQLERRARRWRLRSDSLERVLRGRFDPDSLEGVLRTRINPDSIERVVRRRLNPDSLEGVFEKRFDPDSLRRRALRVRKRADSLFRHREDVDVDSLIHWQAHHADSLRTHLDSLRHRFHPVVDSLQRRIRPRLDSLRRHFEQRREQWAEEHSTRLREQARRLRERAERLDKRAEEMEAPLAPPDSSR